MGVSVHACVHGCGFKVTWGRGGEQQRLAAELKEAEREEERMIATFEHSGVRAVTGMILPSSRN